MVSWILAAFRRALGVRLCIGFIGPQRMQLRGGVKRKPLLNGLLLPSALGPGAADEQGIRGCLTPMQKAHDSDFTEPLEHGHTHVNTPECCLHRQDIRIVAVGRPGMGRGTPS